MTERRDHADVEQRLIRHGAMLRTQLASRSLAPTVLGAIGDLKAERPSSLPRRRTRRIAGLAAAALVISTSTAWAISTLVFDGGPVTVHREPAPQRPVTRELDLGEPISLELARSLPTFVEPDVSWIDDPPTAWLDAKAPGQLSLTYPPGRALPEISSSGVGAVIQSFDGDGAEAIRKYLTNGTRVERVKIDGADAVYLYGGDHLLFYLEADGGYAQAPGQVVGNALIFRHGTLTVRIEADLSLGQMVELAESLRASGD